MISGSNPFDHSSQHEDDAVILDRILTSKINLNTSQADVESNHRNDLINKLLRKERENRLGRKGAAEILKHQYFVEFQSGNILMITMFHIIQFDNFLDVEFKGGPPEFHSEVLIPYFDDFFKPPLNGYLAATIGVTTTAEIALVAEETADERKDRTVFSNKLEEYAVQRGLNSSSFRLVKTSGGFSVSCNLCSLQLKCAKQRRANRTGSNYHIENFKRHYNCHLLNKDNE